MVRKHEHGITIDMELSGSPASDANIGWKIARRDFLFTSVLVLLCLTTGCSSFFSGGDADSVGCRFGLITDLHYADRDPKGDRFYRESLDKMREAAGVFREQKVDFIAELGDFKDMVPGEPDSKTLEHLIAIEREFTAYGGPTYHVIGNHGLDNLSKQQFLTHVTNTGIPNDRSYYAYSNGGVRFIVLDACTTSEGLDYDHGNFTSKDSNYSEPQLAWLRKELATTTQPVIVFGHQLLNGEGSAVVRNADRARALLEEYGKTLAVFTGHAHKGGHDLINGIHYYTLKGAVNGAGAENNSYAICEVHPNLDITVTGYRKAVTMEMPRKVATSVTP